MTITACNLFVGILRYGEALCLQLFAHTLEQPLDRHVDQRNAQSTEKDQHQQVVK